MMILKPSELVEKIFKIDNEELKGITDKAIKYSKENEEKE